MTEDAIRLTQLDRLNVLRKDAVRLAVTVKANGAMSPLDAAEARRIAGKLCRLLEMLANQLDPSRS
jgi:hypothetical protein